MIENPDCIVVANGLFPQKKETIDLLRDNNCTIIACDGAINNLDCIGITHDYIIGDLDSLEDKYKLKYSDRLIKVSEQETNDLTKAMMRAKDFGFKNIIIVAATGLREDHSLGNISLMSVYKEMFDSVCMLSDFGHFISISKTTTFKSLAGQQISIFNLPPLSELESEGLMFPLNKHKLPIWWEGTLNQSISEEFKIIVKQPNANIIVYFSDVVKDNF